MDVIVIALRSASDAGIPLSKSAEGTGRFRSLHFVAIPHGYPLAQGNSRNATMHSPLTKEITLADSVRSKLTRTFRYESVYLSGCHVDRNSKSDSEFLEMVSPCEDPERQCHDCWLSLLSA